VYLQGRKASPIVQQLLEGTGIDLSNGAGIPELIIYQEHFRDHKKFLYSGLSCEDVMFEGQVEFSKRINLLFNDVERYYHVITNLTGAMARMFVCKGATRHVQMTSRTSATRHVANAWPALRVPSPTFDSPSKTAIGILEVARVSPTTSSEHGQKNPCVSVSCVVRHVDVS